MQSLFIKQNISEQKKLKKRQEIIEEEIGNSFPDLFFNAFNVEKTAQVSCENLIGSVEIPVGVAGPIKLLGDLVNLANDSDNLLKNKSPSNLLNEEVLILLATTEGALVASVNRGCKIINQAGGAKVVVKKIGMTRAPVFRCQDTQEALDFVAWLEKNFSQIKRTCESTSNHLTLKSFDNWIRGNLVFVRFIFDTDQAMGMNMVTIALKELWQSLISKQTKVKLLSLSGNVCSDKKDSLINRLYGRGYWVQAEIKISKNLVKELLKIDADQLYQTHVAKNLVGSNLAGSFSQNMHVANTIAAIYLATGQDMAHVVEGSQASLHLEPRQDELYISLTLPNLNLATVGGGTYLAAQTQVRKLIRKGKKISSEQLALVVGVACLAGEISGMAALASHTLASAHQKLSR